MSLAGAISTFSSCNKAGSIPQFSEYLSTNPNNYTALLWRGRAFSIIGDKVNALADFDRARIVSRDPRRSIAEAHSERVKQNVARSMDILNETTRKYPHCGEAWADLGGGYLSYSPPKIREAEPVLIKAIDLAKSNSETDEPWYHWANYNMGDICRNKDDIDGAFQYFTEAIQACDSFTIAHFGMCNCYLKNGNREMAQQYFSTARRLNQTIIPWTTLEEYEQQVQDAYKQNPSLSHAGPSSGGSEANQWGSGGGNGSRGNTGGGGGGRGGGGGDDDESKWQKIKEVSPWIAEYKGRIFVQSEDRAYWYTRDKAGHGGQRQGAGCFVKVYDDKKSTIVFKEALDINMEVIKGKHESSEGEVIKKSKFNTRRRGNVKKK